MRTGDDAARPNRTIQPVVKTVDAISHAGGHHALNSATYRMQPGQNDDCNQHRAEVAHAHPV